jgi:membrane-associated phospholipid phosphatase
MIRRNVLVLIRIVFASCLLLLSLSGPVSYAQTQSLTPEDSAAILRENAILLSDSLEPILQGPSIPEPSNPGVESGKPSANQSGQTSNPNFLRSLLLDQKAIWTSPLHLSKQDAMWLIPFAVATGALIATDRSTSGAIANSENLISVSNDISRIGAGYSTFGTAGVFFLTGTWLHNQRARETGILGTEALIDSSLVGFALKFAFGRERPYQGNGQGLFWQGGNSFPSGHAITTWSLAVVIAEEYSDHKMVGVAAYSVATLVSVARYTSYNHFPSDVLVGSVLGGLIGHYVYHTHHERESQTAKPTLKSHLFPTTISPYTSRTGDHAMMLRWGL